jgi:hypothetical protein
MGYTLDDLKGMSPTICQHAINMEPDAKGFSRKFIKDFLRFQSLLLIFFKRMYHLFLMMIVRKLLKLLRRL